jgi:hypothetical protein
LFRYYLVLISVCTASCGPSCIQLPSLPEDDFREPVPNKETDHTTAEMVLGTLPSDAATWGRWPHQQHASTECSMVEACNMVPYDCRPGTVAPIPRPELGQQFLPGPFTPVPPMHSPASPQYQVPVSYTAFTQYTPTQTLNPPFRHHESMKHPQPRGLPTLPAAVGGFQDRNDGLHDERSISPSIKSEPRSTVSEPASPHLKTIVPNLRVQGAPVYQFHSPIDRLARVIEIKRGILDTPEHKTTGPTEEKVEPEGADTQESHGKTKRKRFCCDIPGCNKMFAQENNLDTHRRAHTGESPYECPICFHRFTQTVNLKVRKPQNLPTMETLNQVSRVSVTYTSPSWRPALQMPALP